MKNNNNFAQTLMGILVGTSIGFNVGMCVFDKIDYSNNLQKNYVSPNNIEIRCVDFDRNGEDETYMTIDSLKYSLKYVDGIPTLEKYEETQITSK